MGALLPLFVAALYGLGTCVAGGDGAQSIKLNLHNSDTTVHYLDVKATNGSGDKGVIILLHGAKFTSHDWVEVGTTKFLSQAGFRVLAPDMPGFGLSGTEHKYQGFHAAVHDGGDFLAKFTAGLGVSAAIIVSPSISGMYSLPFLHAHPKKVTQFIAVAPACKRVKLDFPKGTKAVNIRGEQDRLPSTDFLKEKGITVEEEIIPGAPHACWKYNTEQFHALLEKHLGVTRGRTKQN